MLFEENKKYFRVCDDCGNKKEIERQSYIKNLKKDKHYCLSCVQKGNRNHHYKVEPWNKGLSKDLDYRIKVASIKDSQSKIGQKPWNAGNSYEELKGKAWADSFKKKLSCSKSGVPNHKNRKELDKSKSATYFRKRCRHLLYTEWIRKVLERDNFTCQLCGYKKELEVHHIRKFRDIIEIVAKRLNINLDDYKELTDFEYQKFRDEVIAEHRLDDGITLCRECHKGIDSDRRRFHAICK